MNNYCTNCGRPNPQEHKFCRICGSEFLPVTTFNSQRQGFNDSKTSTLPFYKRKSFAVSVITGVVILLAFIGNWKLEQKSEREIEIINRMETAVREIGKHIESISENRMALSHGTTRSFYDRVYSNDDINIPLVVNLATETVNLYEDYVEEFGSDRSQFDHVASLARTAFFFVKQEEVDRAAPERNIAAISNIINRINTFSNKEPFHTHLENERLLDELMEYKAVLQQSKEFADALIAINELERKINALSEAAEYNYDANKKYNQLVETYNMKLKQVKLISKTISSQDTHKAKFSLVDVELLIPSVDEIGLTNSSGAIK
ncbi:MAG: hypothetical protein PHZ00_02020 [Candidatus Peribacteraceae bacterium]|nr:hypothetical protein [Candidatus Peribacteraceae bacterium]